MEQLSYETAKELKDAGFPQDKTQWILYTIDVISAKASNEDYYALRETDLGNIEVSEVLASPTLSELLEECGEGFESLVKVKAKDGYTWVARGYNYGEFEIIPPEAVANLWLAQNKKKK